MSVYNDTVAVDVAQVYAVERGKHKVLFGHEVGDVGVGGVDAEFDGYGVLDIDKSRINDQWSVDVDRIEPHHDDQYPLTMPHTIANVSVYAEDSEGFMGMVRDDDAEHDRTKLDHMFVQPEARGKGYGLLLWDVYVCVTAAVGGVARGKIGETEDGATYHFLRQRGVPEDDIEAARGVWSGGDAVRWETDAANITNPAPLKQTREEDVVL